MPGDAIVGLIRTGRAVSVHRAECSRAHPHQAAENRLLSLGWNTGETLPKVSARLSVTTMNRPGSLGSISTVVGKQGANIVDLKIGRRTPDIYELLLDVEVGVGGAAAAGAGGAARDELRHLRRTEPRIDAMSEMSEAEVLAEFRAAGALLTGHFVLTSGLHSPFYLQCARVLMDPARAGRLVAALAPRVAPTAPDLVVAPALGGIVLGYELGRQLGCRSIFVERVDGSFTLRRGFEIPPGSRIVIAEDVDHHRPLDPRMHRLLCRRRRRGRRGRLPRRSQRRQGRARRAAALRWPRSTCRPTPQHKVPPELAAIPAVKPVRGSTPGWRAARTRRMPRGRERPSGARSKRRGHRVGP